MTGQSHFLDKAVQFGTSCANSDLSQSNMFSGRLHEGEEE